MAETGSATARWLAMCGLSAICAAAAAGDAVVPHGKEAGARSAPSNSTPAQRRLVAEFTDFAGSEANARSLVTGLRAGTPVALRAPGEPHPAAVTFDPPTRPMGNGNVRISLALARQELANAGITQPTPVEIKMALMGGTVTTGSGATAQTVSFPGVLAQRSRGMGWGKIARSQGLNLGAVVSGAARPGQQGATGAAPRRAHGPGAGTAGVTAGSGAGRGSAGVASPDTHVRGRGIVTALGTPALVTGTAPGAGRAANRRDGANISSGSGGVLPGIVNGTAAAVARPGATAGGGHGWQAAHGHRGR